MGQALNGLGKEGIIIHRKMGQGETSNNTVVVVTGLNANYLIVKGKEGARALVIYR